MSDNTSESAATTTGGGETSPAPARRRRATRGAAAPDAVTSTSAPSTPASAPAPSQADAASTEAAPKKAPAKRASRAKAPKGEPVDAVESTTVEASAPAQDAAGQDDQRPRRSRSRRKPADAELGADGAEQAPASRDVPASDTAPAADETPAARTKAPRKRATRPAASPDASAAKPSSEVSTPEPSDADSAQGNAVETNAVETDAVETNAAETPAAEPKKAPAKRRRASSRPAAAPVEPVVDEEEDETTADAAAAPALDVLAELAGTTGSTAATTAADASAPAAATTAPRGTSPRLATTALLFQAPDATATRPRRRRATSSAGSPEAISEAARTEREQEEAPSSSANEAQDQPTENESRPSGRSSRRRGRRGRGGEPPAASTDEQDASTDEVAADADEAVAEDQVLDADVEQDAAGEDSGEGTDATETDEDANDSTPRRRRRRGGRGRRRPDQADGSTDGDETEDEQEPEQDESGDEDAEEGDGGEQGSSSRRRRRRRRGSSRSGDGEGEPRSRARSAGDEVTALRGSTRLEAKRQRRREGRDAGRRRQIITEAEFLARRESVDRSMVVRERGGRTQIAVLEDGVLVEHYVSNQASASVVGNVYLGRVQNVLPSMEAAFVDVGKGRNAVLYAGEVNWDAAHVEGGSARRIEQALKSGDSVLVQVTKDPIGHKGARLTSQVTLAGRYLVYVPGGGMTGISRKLPDVERNRLKKILREVVPESAGVIVRTAAEGASEDELRADIARLQSQWEAIEKKSKTASAPALLQGEPDMAIRVVRDIFNDDFGSLIVQGDEAWSTISTYIDELAPDLAQKVTKYTGTGDVFAAHRIDEQLAKGMDRKVWLPSGGSLVIDRTEAMTVVDVNTGKFTGSGGTLEETVTRNNLEAAEEIVRQLRLRDIGGMIVVDFIDMVLESNRDLVLRRLVECLGRDRTKHQVAEVTSLGLVQMTRKRVGQGLVEAFSETCEHCHGRGFIVHDEPIEKNGRPDAGAAQPVADTSGDAKRSRRKRGGAAKEPATTTPHAGVPVLPEAREAVKATLATIAAAAAHAHEHDHEHDHEHGGEAHAAPASADVAPLDESASVVQEEAVTVLQDDVDGIVVVEDETVTVVEDHGAFVVDDDVVTLVDDGSGEVVVDEQDSVVVIETEPDAPRARATLDVFAELAARGALAPSAAPADAGADVELELTPVAADLFEAPEADDADGAGEQADERTGDDPASDENPQG